MPNKKKVLWHLPYGIVGGVETLYATIIRNMDDEFNHYITCHALIKTWTCTHYTGMATISLFTNAQDLKDVIEGIDPDIIIGTHGLVLYSALDLLQKKYPVIEVVHGSHVWSEHNVHMPKKYTKHIVCVSKSAERVYLENSNFDIPTSIIINGVDPKVFYPRKMFNPSARVIAYFGRFLEEDKKILKILQAFRSLGTQHAKLYLIGGTPYEIVALRRQVVKLGLQDSVKLFEHTSAPEEYYKEVDLVTVRSEAEGYCNVVAEAMASDVPVVCYNFGGILEHVEPGTVAVADTQAMYARLLVEVFKDARLRQRMIEKGRKFVNTIGNAKVTSRQYIGLINTVLAQPDINETIPSLRSAYKKISLPFVGAAMLRYSGHTVGVVNPGWQGIATATAGCTDVVVPWNANPRMLMTNILKHTPRAILFSGGSPGFSETAKLINKSFPSIPIYGYYHGGMSHFSFSGGTYGQGERSAFLEMLALNKSGIYRKIAVSSPGLEELGLQMGYRLQFTGNFFKEARIEQTVDKGAGVQIGNFNRHLDHKHTSIGLAAGMLVPGAHTHILKSSYAVPLIDYSRVTIHDEMSQDVLYKLYSKMDVCLQMSFIETFNISVMEIWSLGVPVIVGPGNHVLYSENSILKRLCLVEDHTNPVVVADRIERVLENRSAVVSLQYQQLSRLNNESKTRWEEFFDG